MKEALRKVYQEVGGRIPKGKPGKWGSPQRGNTKKGYRYDREGHPNATDPAEEGPHINWWDYTSKKKKAGGRKGTVPVRERGFADPEILEWLVPWWLYASGTGGCDEYGNCQDMIIPQGAEACEYQ
jgi:hypothetical protein